MIESHSEKMKRVETAFGSTNLRWRLPGDTNTLELGPDNGPPTTTVALSSAQAATIRALTGVTTSFSMVVVVAQMLGELLQLEMVGRKVAGFYWGGTATPSFEVAPTESGLVKALSFAELVISEVNCLVAILDRNGRVQRFNRVAEEVTGRKEVDVIGIDVFDVFMTPDEGQESRKNVNYFFEIGKAYEVERTILTKKGPRLYQFRNKFVHCATGFNQDVLVCSGIDITDERRNQEKLAEQARTDPLTGLRNRNHLTQLLSERMGSQENIGRLALLFIDLDNFKRINDSLGHQLGDQLLIKVAHRLQQVVCGAHEIMRVSGDEFVIAILDDQAVQTATLLATQIIKELDFSFVLQTNSYRIRASIGIAEHGHDGDTEYDLITRADLAMYEAKSVGKKKDASTFCLYSEELSARAERGLQLHQALQYGFLRSEFELDYRKIRSLDGTTRGIDIQVGWNRPGLEPIVGSEFLPMVESSGFGIQLGEFAISESFREMADRDSSTANNADYFVMVTVPEAMLLDGDLTGVVRQSLNEHQLNPSRVCLVMPTIYGEHYIENEEAANRISALRAIGVKIFVKISERSAFPNIASLPIDGMVMDSTFAARLPTDRVACAIFKGLLGLCSDIGLQAIVYGVVAQEQLAWLAQFPRVELDGPVEIPVRILKS